MGALILNVDDFEPQLYSRSAILRRAGLEVVEARSAEQALAIVRERHPTLALLDVCLPDLDGLEVCRRIKTDPATASTLVLHLSAVLVDSASRVNALENGADGYLSEPLEPAELLAQVRTLLRLADAEASLRDTGEQLKARFAELEAIYQHAPVGLCVFDSKFRWIRLNQRFAEMNGVPAEAHIGKTPREIVPDLGDQAEAALREILRTGEPLLDLQMAGTTPAQPDVVRWWNERWTPIKDEHGTITGIAVAAEEITARKHAEAALRDSEQRFRAIADNISQLAWMSDASGARLWFNKRWFDYTGASLDEMKDWGWQKAHRPDYLERLNHRIRQASETGLPWEDTVPLRGADGEYRWFLTRVVPIRGESGDVLQWFGTDTDVTEQRAIEEALREANRVKDEFLTTLSHELRTPLNAIVGWAHMLERGLLDPASAQRAIETISRNAMAQDALISDVLDVSRIVTGRLHLDVRPVDVLPVLQEAIDSVQPACAAKRLRVTIATSGGDATVNADRNRLRQVFWNLLSNAVKFTPADGRIALRVSRAESSVAVDVSDTGIGIEPEFLPFVFDRFAQADSSTTRRHGGLGLGLAIVRHLVELHGGAVTVASEGQGRGATFTVHLPVLAAAHPPSGAANTSGVPNSTAASIDGVRVLVVDDDEDTCDLITSVLARHGAVVTSASSAAQALQKVSAARPDVVLADIGMPEVDGYGLLARLRALPSDPVRSTPAIAVTAYGGAAERARALEAGFEQHLTKPVLPEHLVAAVAAAARARRAAGPPRRSVLAGLSSAGGRPRAGDDAKRKA